MGRFQYTGQKWLPSVGLYDYKARTYSPTLGRFMQTDPIGYGDGLNWYNYVGGDPINRSDPTGLMQMVCQSVPVYTYTYPFMPSSSFSQSVQQCGWQYEASDFAQPGGGSGSGRPLGGGGGGGAAAQQLYRKPSKVSVDCQS
ncbi:RHS repeat-associated core domain-containing protein [Sphingomonas sp. MA1305]|uniref:RHS repeat-associated core domain-containing protein n=1 Tax=Sphingomonas sp. MA1305 TaxID=2479204 RepID=UPI001E54B61D|nr:RHS repeat-associated core domain-containing protein [Sphingomonas sp. MA1305]